MITLNANLQLDYGRYVDPVTGRLIRDLNIEKRQAAKQNKNNNNFILSKIDGRVSPAYLIYGEEDSSEYSLPDPYRKAAITTIYELTEKQKEKQKEKQIQNQNQKQNNRQGQSRKQKQKQNPKHEEHVSLLKPSVLTKKHELLDKNGNLALKRVTFKREQNMNIADISAYQPTARNSRQQQKQQPNLRAEKKSNAINANSTRLDRMRSQMSTFGRKQY